MKQNIMPLNETGDKTVFNVPENYFNNFKVDFGKRLDAVEIQEKEKLHTETSYGKFVLNMDKVRPYLYIAAMFVLMIFSIGLVMKYSSEKSSTLLGLSAESNSTSVKNTTPTAEDYLINSVGTYGITEYYVESDISK